MKPLHALAIGALCVASSFSLHAADCSLPPGFTANTRVSIFMAGNNEVGTIKEISPDRCWFYLQIEHGGGGVAYLTTGAGSWKSTAQVASGYVETDQKPATHVD